MLEQRGFAPVLILVALLGIIMFLLYGTYAPFQDTLSSILYPKPQSEAAITPAPTPNIPSPSPTPLVCATIAMSKSSIVNSSTSVSWTYNYPDSTKITSVNLPARAGVKYSINGQESEAGQAFDINLGAGLSQIQLTVMPTSACSAFNVPFKMTTNCGTEISDTAGMASKVAYGSVCR